MGSFCLETWMLALGGTEFVEAVRAFGIHFDRIRKCHRWIAVDEYGHGGRVCLEKVLLNHEPLVHLILCPKELLWMMQWNPPRH